MLRFKKQKGKPSKLIDGLKRKSKRNHEKSFFTFRSIKILKPLRVVLIIVSVILIISGILYAIPKTRSYINLARMSWNGKYLVLFQNNSELRSTGGFIGSFAVIETKHGRIINTYFDSNIYKRDNEFLRNYKVTPKDEVLKDFLVEGQLAMRDSNWALDYSEAAQQVAWFYREEGGADIDGVIAIDVEFFRKLLEIIGEINLVKYDMTIDSSNFSDKIQYEVEQEYFKDSNSAGINEPKSILASLIPTVSARIKNNKNWFSVYDFIFSALKEKHLLLYSYNKSIQSTIVKENWGGTIPNSNYESRITNYDYLYINNSNLGANKSSIYVMENIDLDIQLTDDKITHRLIFRRNYPDVDLSKKGFFYGDNVNNKNYTRMLIPKESKVNSVAKDGNDILNEVKISEEYGKTKLSFWTSVDKGKETTFELNYETTRAPEQKKFELYLQKQPGAINQTAKIIMDYITKYDGIFDQDIITRKLN